MERVRDHPESGRYWVLLGNSSQNYHARQDGNTDNPSFSKVSVLPQPLSSLSPYPREFHKSHLLLEMSDVNTLLVEPLTKFYKDSSYLVKKCTKPDHKGQSAKY